MTAAQQMKLTNCSSMTTRAMRCTLAKLRGKAAASLSGAMISCTGFSGSSSPSAGKIFHGLHLVSRVQIPSQRAEQGADPRAPPMQARQDFLEKFIVEVRLPLAGFPCGLINASFKKN